jgi:tripartite-type tricarboxylate transporter receptor subunit TctC
MNDENRNAKSPLEMSPRARRTWLAAMGAVGLAAAGVPARAANWPSNPLRMVVGFPPGSSPDMLARLLAEPLAKALGQPVVVDNRAGAAGNIGADAVAKATDGHTLGLVPNGPLTSSPYLFPKLPYTVSSFRPVTLVATAPLALVASTRMQLGKPGDFVPELKRRGDRATYGSVGVGSAGHLGTELMLERTATVATHVPFRGAPQVLNALLAGEIDFAMLPLGPSMPLVRANSLAAIGLTSSGRSTLAPELLSLAELGISGLNIEVWNAVVLPAQASQAQAARLANELIRIVRSPEMRDKLFAQGWRSAGMSAEGLSQRIQADAALYGSMIKARNITAGS